MLKCAVFAVFFDFENGCCYLNTIARKRRKTHGFLAFLLKNRHHCLTLGWSWEKNYVKVCLFGRFLRL